MGSSPIVHPSGPVIRAGVAKPVDALGLGPSGATHGGSSPLTRIRTVRGQADRRSPRSRRTASAWTSRSPKARSSSGVRADAIRQLGREMRVPGFRPGQGAGQRGHRTARRPRRGRAGDAEGRHGRLVRRGPRRRPSVEPIDDPDLDVAEPPDGGRAHLQARRSRCARRRPSASTRGLEVGRAEPEVPEGALDAELEPAARAGRAPGAGRAAGRDRRLPDHRLRRRDRRQAAAQSATARDYLVELGGGRLVPELRRRARGPEAGETRTFPVTYADDDGRAGAGRQDRRLHGHGQARPGKGAAAARRRRWPIEVSEFDTLDELRADIAPAARGRGRGAGRRALPAHGDRRRRREADGRRPRGHGRPADRRRSSSRRPTSCPRASPSRTTSRRPGAASEQIVRGAAPRRRDGRAPRARGGGRRRRRGHRGHRRGGGGPGPGRRRGHRPRAGPPPARPARPAAAARPCARTCACARRST